MPTPVEWKSIGLALGLFILVIGCGDHDQIRRYQVVNEASTAKTGLNISANSRPPSSASGQRSLAAIVPHEGQAWFVKAMGPPDQIAPIVDDFDKVVASISFADGKPEFELPDGWERLPGSQFRFATLKTGNADVSVSSLTLPPDKDFQQYLLENVNRWLGQVGKPSLSIDAVGQVTREISIPGGKAILFDSGPVARNEAADEVAKSNADGSKPAADSVDGLTFEVPEDWSRGGNRPMRLATFFADRDGKQVEITLSRLGVNPGSMLANVNRWRGQIGLSPIDDAALKDATKNIKVGDTEAQYFLLDESSAEKAIYVVVVRRPDHTLFVKLMGDRTVAESERATFEKFVESIRFK